MVMLSMVGCGLGPRSGIGGRPASLQKTDWNCLFRMFALPVLSETGRPSFLRAATPQDSFLSDFMYEYNFFGLNFWKPVPVSSGTGIALTMKKKKKKKNVFI